MYQAHALLLSLYEPTRQVQWERKLQYVSLIRCNMPFWMRPTGNTGDFCSVATHAAQVLLFNYWIALPLRCHCHSFNSSLLLRAAFIPPSSVLCLIFSCQRPSLLLPASILLIKPPVLLLISPLQYLSSLPPFLHACILFPSGRTAIWDGRWLICGPIRHKQTFGHLPPELLPCCTLLLLPFFFTHKDKTGRVSPSPLESNPDHLEQRTEGAAKKRN